MSETKEINYYKLALEEASEKMLKTCRPSKDKIDEIATNIQYLVNWRGYKHEMDISDDTISVKKNDKEYNFSKSHFLNNKYFKKNIINEYTKLFGDVYLKFYTSPDNKKCSITISRKRRR